MLKDIKIKNGTLEFLSKLVLTLILPRCFSRYLSTDESVTSVRIYTKYSCPSCQSQKHR